MKNLFRMELFRLFKSPLWWLMLILGIVASAINDLAIQVVFEFTNNIIGGGGEFMSYEDIVLNLALKNSNVTIIIVLFALIFINGLYKGGFHKSLNGIIRPQAKVIIVDYLIQVAFIFVTLIGIIITTALIILAFGNATGVGNLGNVALFYTAVFVAFAGIIALINLLYYVFTPKKFVGTIILGLALVLIIVPLIGQLSTGLITLYGTCGENCFFPADYFNTSNLMVMPKSNPESALFLNPWILYVRMLIIGAVEIALGVSLSIFVVQKRDLA